MSTWSDALYIHQLEKVSVMAIDHRPVLLLWVYIGAQISHLLNCGILVHAGHGHRAVGQYSNSSGIFPC